MYMSNINYGEIVKGINAICDIFETCNNCTIRKMCKEIFGDENMPWFTTNTKIRKILQCKLNEKGL